MSGITGKGPLSIKKEDVQNSRLPALGFKKLVFAHKATAGQTVISTGGLVAPTEMTANGFVQPSLAELQALNLRQFKENVTVKSSLRGELVQFLGFTVNSGSTIKLAFSADENEIFLITCDAAPRTGIAMADAQPLVSSGILEAGEVDYNVGTGFKVGRFLSAQHGEVMVLVDGKLMYRNTGNNPAGPGVTGDYYEVPAGDGLALTIRFNLADAVNDRAVSVFSVGALVQAPNGSEVAMIEALQGQIDAMVPTLAALAGVAETVFQSAPNQPNLKAYGDITIANRTAIAALPVLASGNYSPVISNTSNVSASSVRVHQWLRIGNVVTVSGLLIITATAATATATSFRVTLPVPPGVNFTDEGQLAGAGTFNNGTNGVRVYAETGTLLAHIDFTAGTSGSPLFLPWTATYTV